MADRAEWWKAPDDIDVFQLFTPLDVTQVKNANDYF